MDGINFRFYLNFKNNSVGRLEITEPIGFDGVTFTIEQDSKRYGRDVAYGSEEVSMSFFSGVYNNGLTHQLENLLRYYVDYGFESEDEFIVNKDGVDFVVGLLDFKLAETDQITYFKTKVIQNTAQAIVKRREDVNVDVFSDKDLDDNPITPVETQRILLNAKPVQQFSEWEFSDKNIRLYAYPFADDYFNAFNFISNVKKSSVENTLSYIGGNAQVFTSSAYNLIDDFVYIESLNLFEGKLKISDVSLRVTPVTDLVFNNCTLKAYYYIGATFDYSEKINLFNNNIPDGTNLFVKNFNFETDIIIQNGFKLWFWIEFKAPTPLSGTLPKVFNANFTNGYVNVEGTSTAIDSVIDGVRHIDYVKQVFKSATGLNVIAPKYDVGGQFYDNFVFNGKLIRQFSDQAFYGTIKENVSQLVELNSDYQINKDGVYIGQYNDFYTNKEIGAFLTAPEQSFKSEFNDRYTINRLEYKYKSFEQDRDESNTIDAIHTSTQWLLPNKQVENNLKIEVDFVRDPFEIESARKQGIYTKDTTSLSNDDKVYIIDCVPLAPNTRKNFTAVLQYQYSDDDNTFKILSNGSFNWTLLGFNVGNTIKVNGVDYVVQAYESSIITLVYTGSSDDTGSEVFTIDYPLTNVGWQNRTNQEFNLIENIATGDNFSNLQYSIGRNLEHWYSYLKTACKFWLNGKIKNTYFKSNGEAITQFRSGRIIKENADILVADLGDAILSPYVYTTKLVADYNDVLSVLEKMETINPDDSIGGFIRVMDNEFRMAKIYPTKLSYKWATAELDIIGEVKQESEFLEITSTTSGLIIIDEVGYDTDIIKPLSLRTEGDYIQILDSRGIALNNLIKFDKLKVNSNIFTNIVELSDELLTL